MESSSSPAQKATTRDLLFLGNPRLWPTWPYLAVVRRRTKEKWDYGVVYDAFGRSGRTGISSTELLTNFFEMPDNEEELLAMPKEVFDTVEELAASGWTVD